MIHITSETTVPTVDSTLNILRQYSEIMPTFIDFDKTCQYLSFFQLNAERMKEPLYEILQFKDMGGITVADAMKRYLMKTVGPSGFKTTQNGISLSKTSIDAAKESGTMSDEVSQVVSAYQKFTSYRKMARTLLDLLQYPVCALTSYDNHRMLVCRPSIERQNTGRAAYNNPAIQNFPRVVQDILTVPKGWILLHTDSGQVEPRITYSTFIKDKQIQTLIMLYDDAYLGLVHYIFLSDEDIASGRTDFVAQEVTDEMRSKRKAFKTFGNAVMYGSTSNPSNDPVKAAMIKRIGNHKLRQQRIKEIDNQLIHGIREFPCAFGTKIDISKSDKLQFGGNYEQEKEELIRLAINNPIQGTAAELFRISVREAHRILSLKASNSAIINYVHDAGTFAIAESDYDKVYDELADVVAYDVEGWLPIKAEPEKGRGGGLFEDLY